MPSKEDLQRQIDRLRARLDALESRPVFEEKRVVDLIVRLTTEHVEERVERQLRELAGRIPEEKRVVDLVVRLTAEEVERRLARPLRELSERDDRRLADEIARRVADRLAPEIARRVSPED